MPSRSAAADASHAGNVDSTSTGVTGKSRDSDSGRSPLLRCGKYVSRKCTLDLAPVQVRDTFCVLLNRASLDLFGADDVFLTASGVGIVPDRSLDGQPGGHGAQGHTYRKIRAAFGEATAKLGGRLVASTLDERKARQIGILGGETRAAPRLSQID
jgi:hypothetical protein